MTQSLMFGEELERSEADGGDGVIGAATTSSANMTHGSDGEPDHSGDDQTSPLGQDESSNTAKDCYSDTPLVDADWPGEEMSLQLHPASPEPGNGYKRSPTRGMLRAVSSITITDIEAFEEGLSTFRGNLPHAPLVDVHTNTNTKRLSPVPASTSTENISAWSPSYRGSTTQKPRRGAGKSRRRREQRGEAWYSDDEILDEMGSPDRPPFSGGGGEDTVSMASLIRRKSIDILPNVPRRAPSTQDLADAGSKATNKHSSDEESEMKRLMHRLHNELYLPGSKTPKPPKPNNTLENSTNNTYLRGMSHLDAFTNFPPRRHMGGELAVDRFDRFNSDVDPFNNLLPRHQSLDGMLFPVQPRSSVGVVEGSGGGINTSRLTADDESESEPESSHFKVREFVVSLDYLEDNKTRGDMPRRRRSFDALPTPPRRFWDELEAEDGEETSVRRRSFDDLGSVQRRPLDNERHSGKNHDSGLCLDQSHRSQQTNVREGGTTSTPLDASHRSQIGYPIDQSIRSQQGYTPLDRSHRSQSNGSAEMNEEDRSIRRTSHDILPALPRRRFASESSSSDSELSPLPLRMDDALVQKKAADVVPNAPRRTDSGIGSKASSLSFSDIHLDEVTVSSSSGVKDPSALSPQHHSLNLLNPNHLNNSGHLRLKSCDQIPSLPTRDHSLTAFDIFDVASEDQGNHADTEDNAGSHLEPDYESIDGTTSDRSLLVPIKDHRISSSSKYSGSNGMMMNRTLVDSSIMEGGTSEELSPSTPQDGKDSSRRTSSSTTTTSPKDEDHHHQHQGDNGDGDDDQEEEDHDDHDDEDDTETTSVEHHHDKEADPSFQRKRANRRRKKKSSFLLRLFASRN